MAWTAAQEAQRQKSLSAGAGILASQGNYFDTPAEKTYGGQSSSYLSPEVLQYIASMTGIGYDTATAMEGLKYQKERDDKDRAFNYWAAEKDAQTAAETAKAAGQRAVQAANIGAEAEKYAADQDLAAALAQAEASRYAADKAFEATQLTEANKIKIAAANLNLESKRIAAEEMGAPSDWRTQAGYLRSQNMTQADITPAAIQQAGTALGPVAPELAPTTAPPPMAAPTAPQAIVGEQGPELATATPQGTQITPIQKESAWWLRKQGAPQFAAGGTVGYGMPTTPIRSELLNPSQMLQRMTERSTTVPEYLAREEQGRRWLGGGLPLTVGGGVAPTTPGITPTGGGGTATPIVGPGGESPIPVTPATAEPPYIDMLRQGSYVPSWEAWGGPRTKPEVGMDIPIKMPHEINYGNFMRLTPTEQQMAFADWHALGMAPDTALRIMQLSAMRGTAQGATAYG